MPIPTPGTYSFLPKWVKLAYKKTKTTTKKTTEFEVGPYCTVLDQYGVEQRAARQLIRYSIAVHQLFNNSQPIYTHTIHAAHIDRIG